MSLPVPAGGELVLDPLGSHLMLVGLADPLTTGERFDITLAFATAGASTPRSRCGTPRREARRRHGRPRRCWPLACGGGDGTAGIALPDLELPALDAGGAALDVGAIRGPAVVNVWATWCVPVPPGAPRVPGGRRVARGRPLHRRQQRRDRRRAGVPRRASASRTSSTSTTTAASPRSSAPPACRPPSSSTRTAPWPPPTSAR